MASVRPVLLAVLLPCFLPLFSGSSLGETRKLSTPIHASNAWTLPLAFERNEGQLPDGIDFVGRTQRYTVAISRKDLRFAVPGAHRPSSIVLSFEGSTAAAPVGLAQLPFRTNYYVGSDTSKYRAGVKNYSRVGLSHVYAGVDAEFYAAGDAIEHDFIVAPGADASAIAMHLSGSSRATISNDGEVLIPADAGELRLKKPVAYQQTADGRRVEVAAEFLLAGSEGTAGGQGLRFKLGSYDHTRTLVIDPVIVYSTFLAGAAGSTANAIATDPTAGIFVAGTTTSAAATFAPTPATSTATPITPTVNCTATCTDNIFVANFSNSSASAGMTLQWVTYIGATDPASSTTVTSLVQGLGSVYIGGSTNDSALAAGAGATALNPTSAAGGYVGYISSLATATGVLNATAMVYVDPQASSANSTSVQGLAFDGVGSLYATGAIGTQTVDPALLTLATTGDAFPITPLVTAAVNPSVTPAQVLPLDGNAYVMKLAGSALFTDPATHLVAPSYFTYIQNNTQLNAIAIDAIPSIYVAGQTLGSFSLPNATATNSDVSNTYDAFELTFQDATVAPAITPSSTVTAFTWLDGNKNDSIAALAVDPAGNSYLFGNTTSTNLGTTAGVVQGMLADAVANGFVAQLLPQQAPLTPPVIPAGGTPPAALTYLGGSGVRDVLTGGVYANSTLYITGQTDAPAASAPAVAPAAATVAFAGVATTTGTAAPPFIPQATVFGMDATIAAVPGAPRGFLASINSTLTAVNFVANIGGSGGSDSVAAVALDASQNAYLAANIGYASVAASTPPYTPYNAYQVTSPAASPNSSAYIAEVAAAGSSANLTFAVLTPGSPSPATIGYPNQSGASTVVYTWTLSQTPATSTAIAPANVVIQIPPPSDPALSYSSITITDVTNAAISPGLCTMQPLGISCVIANYPQMTPGTNDTLNVVLNAQVVADPAGPTITVTANLFTAASDYYSVPQVSQTLPSNITIQPASAFPAITVNSTNAGASTPNTQATYAFVVANAAGAGESKTASFSLSALPAGFQFAVETPVVAGGAIVNTCDLSAGTGCSSLDLPGGSSVTYTLIGTYPDSIEGTAKSAAAGNFVAGVTGFQPAIVNQSIQSSTTVQRAVHLSLTSSFSAFPNGQTLFNVADVFSYTVTVTNSGPSASSGQDPLTLTLPNGFVVSSVSGITCAAPYTSCTIPVIAAAGGTSSYTVTGSFPDNAQNQVIHGTGAAGNFPEIFSAVASINTTYAAESGGPVGDYSTSMTTHLQRTALIKVTTASVTPPTAAATCSGGGTCVYMKTLTANPADLLAYNFVVDNQGPNIATGTTITINLPIAPGQHLLPVSSPTVTFSNPGVGFTPISCTVPANTNQLVCTGALPVGTGTATVSGSGIFDAATVPLTAAAITTGSPGGTVGSINVTEDSNGAPLSPSLLASVEIDRAVHLVTTKSITLAGASPINLDENAASAACGADDCFTTTVQVANGPLNDAPGVSLTEMLPPYFRFIQLPSGGANCTIAGVAPTLAYRTPSTGTAMVCAIGTVVAGSTTQPPAATSFSYQGKFVDNGINPDITGVMPAKQGLVTPATQLGSAVAVTSVAVDPAPTTLPNNQSLPSTIAVRRLTHLVLRKTRNTTVAAVPGTFADKNDINLDEKTTATAFGVNDEVEYDVAVGNAGPNQALGVQFTESLPPYFTLVNYYLVAGASTTPDTGPNTAPVGQMPRANLVCYADAVGGTILTMPFKTGSAGQKIVCSYGSPTTGTPQSPANYLSLTSGNSKPGAPDSATSIEFVYQGKYQDNAPNADNIVLNSTAAITSAAGDSVASSLLEIDTNVDNKSAAIATYSVQRAAHLVITGVPQQTTTAEVALPSQPGMPSIIAQAAPSSLGGSTPVYNCIRYKVLIQNVGPNIARQPQLTIVKPSGFTLAGDPMIATTTPGSSVLPAACSYVPPVAIGNTVPSTLAAVPVSQAAGNTLVIDLDGYFGLNTLAGVNAQTGFTIAYSALSDSGIQDSLAGSAFAPITGGSVTVVNTPYGSNFNVAPFSAAVTQPALLTFGTIASPGATTLALSGTGPAVPAGASPDPRDSKRVIPLYRTGAKPTFYTLATTAIPQAGSNPTGICLTNGGVGLDTFAKPERTLLWALANLPGGTALNTVPNAASPYPGDITTSLTPLAKAAYVTPGGSLLPYTSYATLPAPQSQPRQICGQVNGFAPAAAPVTLAALEPVNFAPYITAASQAASQTPGKGVSEVSFLFPSAIHDYNDHDPCYVSDSSTGSPRGFCDDNLLLTTWIFGGESLIPSLNHVLGPLTPAAANAFVTAPTPYEVQANATLYFQVADQLAAPIYSNAPNQNCDPGDPSSSYTPISLVKPCPIDASKLVGTPPQETVFGSADIALLTPGLNGGSSGLIILPPAADATLKTTPVQAGYVAAAATVTAGQTVGFQWKLGDIIPAAGGTYNLACFLVDAATQNTQTAFPSGLSCQIPASIVYPVNPTPTTSPANPAIYIVTTGTLNARNSTPSWTRAAGGIIAAFLLPLLFLRRRLLVTRSLGLLVLLLLLGGAMGLSGCGSGVGTANTPAVAASTYFFRATATPVAGGTPLITAPFQVTVAAGN